MSEAPYTIHCGDALTILRTLPSESVQTCVTSPPYWGLRDYGVPGQIGLEASPTEYLERMVTVFAEVRRVLRSDGTCWVNMGDSYCSSEKWGGQSGGKHTVAGDGSIPSAASRLKKPRIDGIKEKDLVGMPWTLALALRADGWYLRSDVVWHKSNPMPESVYDRPTKAHEYIFLLTKNWRYFYDHEAIREPVSGNAHGRGSGVNPKARYKMPDGWNTGPGAHGSFHPNGREKGKTPAHSLKAKKNRQNESFSAAVRGLVKTRNKRSVWTVATSPYRQAHFATFPPKLIKPCVLAGCPVGGVVLDPFAGSGTTGQVALENGRKFIGIELNPAYLSLISDRLNSVVAA